MKIASKLGIQQTNSASKIRNKANENHLKFVNAADLFSSKIGNWANENRLKFGNAADLFCSKSGTGRTKIGKCYQNIWNRIQQNFLISFVDFLDGKLEFKPDSVQALTGNRSAHLCGHSVPKWSPNNPKLDPIRGCTALALPATKFRTKFE